MYTHSCAQTPRWSHHFLVHYSPACSGFILHFSAKDYGHLWGSIVQCASPCPTLSASSCVFLLLSLSIGSCNKSQAGDLCFQLGREHASCLLQLEGEEMSAVIKSKLYDLHKPTQLYLRRTNECSTWVGMSRKAAPLGKCCCSPQVRVSILKIQHGTLLFVLDLRAGWMLLFTASVIYCYLRPERIPGTNDCDLCFETG